MLFTLSSHTNEYSLISPPLLPLLSSFPKVSRGLQPCRPILSPLVCSDLTWPDLREALRKKAILGPLVSDFIVFCHGMTIQADIFVQGKYLILQSCIDLFIWGFCLFIHLQNVRASLKCCQHLLKLLIRMLEKKQVFWVRDEWCLLNPVPCQWFHTELRKNHSVHLYLYQNID